MTPKFRTWLKNDKAMVFIASLPFPNTKGRYQEMAVGFWMDADYFFSDDDGIDYTNIDDCVLMQSTGLNDKNGREIYEGDIIQFYNHYNYEVYFNQDYSAMRLKSRVEERAIYLFIKDGVVVGNIYENPELLEELGL